MIKEVNRFVLFHVVVVFGIVASTIVQDELEAHRALESFVELEGGEFFMGINDREGVNFENPQRKAVVTPFRIHLYPVTVASFKKYKNAKYRHRTDAELAGSSWVFDRLIDSDAEQDTTRLNDNDPDSVEARNMSMIRVMEARWNRPEGGSSNIYDRFTYPVVHISYNDAVAYCAWLNMRLPTEIEWEFAARGGLKEKLYPWGDKWEVGRTNLWQGRFPDENQKRDKYYGLSPVDAFKAQNDYEMYDMLGNVWEWTSTIFRDSRSMRNEEKKSNNGTAKTATKDRRVLKGGSYMDNRDGESRADHLRIRISARVGHQTTYSAHNVGFRCVQAINPNERAYKFKEGVHHRVVRLRAPKYHQPRNEL